MYVRVRDTEDPMSTQTDTSTEHRTPLSRERVLEAAIALADEAGIEAVSMRKLGQELGVEAMSLYNHVANKEDLLDGMVDTLIGRIDLTPGGTDWRAQLRHLILSARSVMSKHQWAPQVIETRVNMTPPLLTYVDSIIGIFREANISLDLTHHALHALGSRMLGFTQELFDDSDEVAEDPDVAALMMQQMLAAYPNIAAMMDEISHDEESIIGSGCDDDVEFVFSLDLILDGIERLRTAG